MRRGDAHFSQRTLAAGADVFPDAVVGYLRHEVPSARALVAAGGKSDDSESRRFRCGAFGDGDSRNVDDLLESCSVTAQKSEQLAGCSDFNVGFEAFANALIPTSRFEDAKSLIADAKDLLPLVQERSGIFGEDFVGSREERKVDAGFAAFDDGQILPDRM